ncbi:hypothetical protein COV23_00165 [Candidatus Wolfebacteria bacterium CG10_big_fil_rev_8_21_14_0_10_31_9]|uniref:Uncharacterized protein n=1 Tax=Candidatus Wolfebacteria bacterium CG10_big_fil_rev_8_21_14_0_10_31_9 TaxID=1975070 RepID=A0A2H0RDC7_9BACT|nr:MAG: hypothetical protein COV23_00165 [Candidatus Wolfebacteria bacterium CG10_big_fil_rev_8_21_14_0_10_31_9]
MKQHDDDFIQFSEEDADLIEKDAATKKIFDLEDEESKIEDIEELREKESKIIEKNWDDDE